MQRVSGRGGWCAPSSGRAGETFHIHGPSHVMHCSDVRLHLGSITHDQLKSRVSLEPHLTHPEMLRKSNFVELNLNNSEIVAQLWGAGKNNLNIKIWEAKHSSETLLWQGHDLQGAWQVVCVQLCLRPEANTGVQRHASELSMMMEEA